MMKKIISCLMAVLLTALSFSGCAKPANQINNAKISIVATIFPQYDWIRQILGDKLEQAELTLLLDDGVDLHSYQPTMEDIAKISNCDMFIYVGGESDAWVEDALKASSNKEMVVINLLEVLGDWVKQEEIIEGMEHTHEHEHDEVSAEDIEDRPLSDWEGNWTTVEKALVSGDLDEYVTQKAWDNETEFQTQKTTYEKRWKSAYETLTIKDSSVGFNGIASDYEYIGYKLAESDHGVSVWYGFENKKGTEGVPRYIAFSDHQIESRHEHEHEDEHENEHEHEDTPHFHFRYGNESFEALTAIEDWSPTFFASDAKGEEIAGAMSGHNHAQDAELDEHVWLSLRNAQTICAYIAAELGKTDPQNASLYAQNAEGYNAKLTALDDEYKAAIETSASKTLLFGDRFPFRYLVDDYGLAYHAAFSGCSAEAEASFETIAFLSNKIDELGLRSIMVIETSDQSIAKTIVANTGGKNQTILVLDSMQSVTAADVASGTTYLSVMESNLKVLKKALS